MQHPGFFDRAGPFALGEVAAAVGAELGAGAGAATRIVDVVSLADAGPGHLAFLDNRKYLALAKLTKAAACLVHPTCAEALPAGTVALVTETPYHAFARALALFYPDASRPPATHDLRDGFVHPSAEFEDGVRIEPGAVIGPQARIGRNTVISAGAVIGRRVTIGRNSVIGPGASLVATLVGDRVIIHAGARLGQDGFGFAMGLDGHLKVPQIGRVIVQDDVEIGANTTIDRGALKDTVIGEGTKIDNLVQIGHNVRIGRHCVIVALTGIAGSTELGDFVVMGGQSGAAGHLKIGSGAQIAASGKVKDDVAPGAMLGGIPARPIKQWAREVAALRRLASPKRAMDRHRASGAETSGDDDNG